MYRHDKDQQSYKEKLWPSQQKLATLIKSNQISFKIREGKKNNKTLQKYPSNSSNEISGL